MAKYYIQFNPQAIATSAGEIQHPTKSCKCTMDREGARFLGPIYLEL